MYTHTQFSISQSKPSFTQIYSKMVYGTRSSFKKIRKGKKEGRLIHTEFKTSQTNALLPTVGAVLEK